MNQSLRDVLHLIVDKLSYDSESQREAFHDLVDGATPAPPKPAAPVVTTPTEPTADDPYPGDQAPRA
jgi:hypothetical protein